MVAKIWWMRSQMAFACGFLIVVGLRFMPYESHNVSKCNLNPDLLSYIKYWHLGYLHNQILLTNWLIQSDDLSNICSSIVLSLPLTFMVINRMIVGNSTTSNQLEAGLIMVRAVKSIDEPSLPLSVYGPMRMTHKASHGVLMTILDGRCPYFCVSFLFTWQVLHNFVMDWMVFLIPFHYIAACIVSLRWVCPGCWRECWYHMAACRCKGFGITSQPLLHMQLLFSIIWSSSHLSRTALLLNRCFSIVSAFYASTISFTVRGYISSSSLRFAETWFIWIVFVSSGSSCVLL